MLAVVTAIVSTIETSLTRRELARAEARRVKKATRTAVTEYMHIISRTARQVTRGEAERSPFVMPLKRSMSSLLASARTFVDEAARREASFVDFGMPLAFVEEFRVLVDRLDSAVAARNNGRAWRIKAQTGLETAVREGMEAVHVLDVIVPNVLRGDAAGLGHWRGSRHIDGIRSARVRRARTVDLDKAS